MTAKKKIAPVDTEAPATEETPATEQATEPAQKPTGRVAWCDDCFATSKDRGPEAKLDASGHPIIYSAAGESCHACGKPAAHYAPYLAFGDRYQRRDAVVRVLSVDPLMVLPLDADPSEWISSTVAELVCL